MDIYWPEAFGAWLDRLEADARGGDSRARTILVYAARALDQLRNLPEPPVRDSETATLRWVRQSRRFPPDRGTVVVALFAADKARLGDVFYDGVAARADPLIDQWKRETAQKEEE